MKKRKCVECGQKRLCLKIVQMLGGTSFGSSYVCRKCLRPAADPEGSQEKK